MQRPISAQPYYGSLQDRTNLRDTSSSKFYQDYSVSNSKKLTKRPGANRLTPQTMIHDKEQLYSQTMNLKQQIHDLQDENLRVKTRLAFLDKENTRLNNYIMSGESASSALCSKNFMVSSTEKETSSMLINLKNLLRQAKEQIISLQESNTNLKRTVKYTKINELEIQKKALLDETGRLKAIVDELINNRNEEMSDQNAIESLTHELKFRMKENDTLLDLKERYEQDIMHLQNSLHETEQKARQRESKIVKDLKIAKQKILDGMRKQQIYQNYIATLIDQKENKPNKAVVKCSNIAKNSISTNNKISNFVRQRTNEMRPETAQTRKPEVNVVRASNFQVKKNNEGTGERTKPLSASVNASGFKQIAHEQLARPHIPSIPLNEQDNSSKVRNQRKSIQSEVLKHQKSNQQGKPIEPKSQASVVALDCFYDKMKRTSQELVSLEAKGNLQRVFEITSKDVANEESCSNHDTLINKDEEDYNQQFDEDQADKADGEQYGEDFQAEVIEQTPSRNEQVITQKQPKKKPKTKKKASKQDLNPLNKLTELIALRLKAQQYPIDELMSDILVSCPETIEIAQLADLLQKEPFLISQHSIELMLKALFKADTLIADLTITTQLFVGRLASLIKPCELLNLEDEELLASQIHDILSQNWQDITLMLERQQNPDGTVCRAVLEKCLKTIGLSNKHLQMIVSDLSLSCEDLQHLEYINLYEIYFDSRQSQQFDEEEPMEILQGKNINHRHTIPQEYEESSMSNDHVGRYHRNNNNNQQRENRQLKKQASFSMKGDQVDDFASEDLPSGFI